MSVHASILKIPVVEIPLDYGRRVEGSVSKLSTWRDGAKILWTFAMLYKETKPFRFFGILSIYVAFASIGFMLPILAEYVSTGLVPRVPSWILAVGLALMSMLLAVTGTILDSVARGRAEQKRLLYLSVGPVRRGDASAGIKSLQRSESAGRDRQAA
jgi:hypothetical protein